MGTHMCVNQPITLWQLYAHTAAKNSKMISFSLLFLGNAEEEAVNRRV